MAIYLGDQVVGLNGLAGSSGGSFVTLETLDATHNTTYTATPGYAYSSVNVNVPATLKAEVIRPDAALKHSYSQNYLIKADGKIDLAELEQEDGSYILPAYSTSSKVLKTAQVNLGTPTLDLNTYDYYIVIKTLTIPQYSVTSKAKGREEYHFSEYVYEIVNIEGNTFQALLDGTKMTALQSAVIAGGNFVRECYWSSATAITLYSSTTYGVFQSVTTPALSSTSSSSPTLTLKDTKVGIRGHTTYFTSTYYNALTDVRIQNLTQVYAATKNNLNINGWNNKSVCKEIAERVANYGSLL